MLGLCSLSTLKQFNIYKEETYYYYYIILLKILLKNSGEEGTPPFFITWKDGLWLGVQFNCPITVFLEPLILNRYTTTGH